MSDGLLRNALLRRGGWGGDFLGAALLRRGGRGGSGFLDTVLLRRDGWVSSLLDTALLRRRGRFCRLGFGAGSRFGGFAWFRGGSAAHSGVLR